MLHPTGCGWMCKKLLDVGGCVKYLVGCCWMCKVLAGCVKFAGGGWICKMLAVCVKFLLDVENFDYMWMNV